MGTVTDIRTKLPFPQLGEKKIDEKLAIQAGAQYECGRCKAVVFKLFADGRIACYDCDVEAKNIVVNLKTTKETAA